MISQFLGPIGQKVASYLGLSAAGAVKLVPYTEECHADSLKKYIQSEKKITIRDPLKFYLYLCSSYCTKNSISPDSAALYKVASHYAIDTAAPLYLPPEERRFSHRNIPSTKEVHRTFKFNTYGEFDDIAEAIKIHAYNAAGLIGKESSLLFDQSYFAQRAHSYINECIEKHISYKLNLPLIVDQINTFIEHTLSTYHDVPHIKKISSREDAILKAQQDIAEYVPILLRPFIEQKAL
jgi:hypothetical protein